MSAATRNLDAEIDKLYQLPLEEFTAARNALAKEAGRDGAAIKQLQKPPVPAWAVNQLYWDRRPAYDSLVDAAERMRKAHKAVIEGRRGDLRAAGREHDLALDAALKATVDLLKERGQTVTDASRHAILNTLRALPGEEPRGRLSQALAPGGFEMLAGITPKKGSSGPQVRRSEGSQVGRSAYPRTQGAKDPRTDKEARQRAEREAAERAVRDAEHRARRAEFETARAVRDATKAEKRLEEARQALERAKEEAAAADRDAAAALRTREAAVRKSRDAESALEAARLRVIPHR